MFVEIQDTLVSLDLLKEPFCCDYEQCRGECCVEGDAGAPVEEEEIAELEAALEVVWDELTPQAREVIDRQGVAYVDIQGDLVTSIVNGRDCVFARKDENGSVYCTIDRAYREGKLSWQKPISCHLYPVRLSKVGDMTAVNYHRWNICECGRCKGRALHLPMYKFLKEPLIRRFSQAWYDEVELVAGEVEKLEI